MKIVKSAAAVLISGVLIGGVTPAWASIPADNLAPKYQTSQFLDQLASAKQLDWQSALDPSVTPITRADYLDQMNKADNAIRLISHGFDVPQEELADALWTPPKAITPEAREELIQELQTAKQEDDHNEQAMFTYSEWSTSDGGGAPVDTAAFDQQIQLVDGVIQDLEIGQGVHWSAVREALDVPASAD
jgi:hypothetical protein